MDENKLHDILVKLRHEECDEKCEHPCPTMEKFHMEVHDFIESLCTESRRKDDEIAALRDGLCHIAKQAIKNVDAEYEHMAANALKKANEISAEQGQCKHKSVAQNTSQTWCLDCGETIPVGKL